MLLSSSLSLLLNPLFALPLFSFFFIFCVVDYYSGVLSGTDSHPSVPLTRMTVKGGTSQACAACKYQRRKCTADCPLAPFFPPDKPKMFQNAHRLYGVSNILKIITHLSPADKIEAMKSIIFQSDMREKYPVHGCVGIIMQLTQQVRNAEAELQLVRRQLEIYRQHHNNQIASPPEHHSLPTHFQQLQLNGNGNDSKNVLPLFNPQPFSSIPVGKPQYHSFSNVNNAVEANNYIDSRDNSLWFQQQQQYNNNNLLAIQPQSFNEFPLQQVGVFQDYDDIPPNIFDTIDDRQSYIDSKEPCESSSESSFRDTKSSAMHLAANELKDAAACFSLTNIN